MKYVIRNFLGKMVSIRIKELKALQAKDKKTQFHDRFMLECLKLQASD